MKKYWLGGLLLLLAGAVAALYRPDLSVAELVPRYAPPPSRFMALDGMQVHYRVEGNPADSVPLVLLHGTGAMLQTWDGWVQALAPHRRLIRLDLPGYALTGPHPQNQISGTYYAGFVSRFLSKLGVPRCDLAGNSLGGNIAWHIALLDSARVRRLVLIDAAGYPSVPRSVPLGFRLARVPGLSGLLCYLTPDALFRSSLQNVYFADSLVTPARIRTYADLNRRAGNRASFVQRRPQPDSLWQQMGRIAQPTLILWGQHDDLIPVATAARFRRDLPHSTPITYPNAGHVPMEEIPAQTARDFRVWSERLKTPSPHAYETPAPAATPVAGLHNAYQTHSGGFFRRLHHRGRGHTRWLHYPNTGHH